MAPLQGKLEAATAEVARTEELEEAAFSIIKQARHELPKELPYHDQYLRWLLAGPSIGEAYTQRAAFYAAAKCFLQASTFFFGWLCNSYSFCWLMTA